MRTIFFAVLGLLFGASNLQAQKDPYAEFIAQTNPRSPQEERKSFHVPAGFEVQLVAAEPDVRKPINMNFDDHGRTRCGTRRGFHRQILAAARPRWRNFPRPGRLGLGRFGQQHGRRQVALFGKPRRDPHRDPPCDPRVQTVPAPSRMAGG